MAKKQKFKLLSPDTPLRHENHARPITRREFISRGFIGGSATLLGGGIFSLFANPNAAIAAVSADLDALATDIGCTLGGLGSAKVPFICFDLAGGANLGWLQCAGWPGWRADGSLIHLGVQQARHPW